MNKSIKLLLTLLVFTNVLYAQDTKELEINIENLSKEWEIVDLINPDKTKEELKEMLSLLEGITIQLFKDKTYEYTLSLDDKGTWELKDRVIHTKDSRGKTKWVIHHLEKKTLILSRNEATQKLVFKPVKN